MISRSRPDSVGGGSSRNVRGLQKPSRFSGGGVVAERFVVSRSRPDSVGGGIVAESFVVSRSRPDSVGGVVAESFVVSRSRPDSVGGGVAQTFFVSHLQKPLARERCLPHIRSSHAIFMNR